MSLGVEVVGVAGAVCDVEAWGSDAAVMGCKGIAAGSGVVALWHKVPQFFHRVVLE